jgi:hypothetical protein
VQRKDKIEILKAIEELKLGNPNLGYGFARDLSRRVLQPLLAEDGYDIYYDAGEKADLVGIRPQSEKHVEQTVAITFKFWESDRPIGIETVHSIVDTVLSGKYNRAILLGNTRFSKQSRLSVERNFPLAIELLDLDALRAWVDRLYVDQETIGTEVRIILRAVSSKFISMIAQNQLVLRELEWRDIERLIAEVFSGLGFTTTLTPPSKDGGKDIVLECTVQGSFCTYVVEIKHWRSKSRVGGGALREFVKVVAREERNGGLFLSTYGYCDNAFEQLSEIERKKVRLGDKDKVVALCRTYEKARSGLWSPPENLAEVLYEGTV